MTKDGRVRVKFHYTMERWHVGKCWRRRGGGKALRLLHGLYGIICETFLLLDGKVDDDATEPNTFDCKKQSWRLKLISGYGNNAKAVGLSSCAQLSPK